MAKADLKEAILAGLAMFAVIYIMLVLGEKLLAAFTAFAGVSMFGEMVSRYKSEISLSKYKMQLEIFDAVIYVGAIIVALGILVHTANLLKVSQYLPSGLVSFASVSQPLEIAIMIFAAISYAQHAAKPNYYSWLAFMCVVDLVINQNTYQGFSVSAFEYLIIGISILALCLGAYFGLKLSLTSFTGLFALLIALTGISLAVNAINQSNLISLSVPSWFPTISSALLLGMVLFMFITYLVERGNATPFLAGASIWALSTYGLQGLEYLINLALFSIAVFIMLSALGAKK